MVSSHVLTKPPATLRHQLHDLIFRDLCRPHYHIREKIVKPWCQTLSTVAHDDSDKPPGYKRIRPDGRVIGKPGRRQQVVSEQLKTNSLNRPSNIIVLRDVKEKVPSVVARDDHGTSPGVLSHADGIASPSVACSITAEEIEGYVKGRHQSLKEAEVNASIDGLRPASSILDVAEFNTLARQLSERYTMRQLRNYVDRSVKLLADGVLPARPLGSRGQGQLQHLTRWQPGRTPLERSLSRGSKKSVANSKTRFVDQLLRQVWKITILSEEQAIGELEMRLEPWHIAMLFEVHYDGQPSYKNVITSKYLLDTSDIQAYRPRNILRITARRQDAEDISKQISSALAEVHQFDFDLRAFEPLLHQRILPEKRTLLCTEDLNAVSNTTQSLICSMNHDVLRVYSFTESMQHTARRLLVALLGVPGPCSFYSTRDEASSMIERPAGVFKEDIMHAPIYFAGVSDRYRDLDLVRASQGVLPLSPVHGVTPNPSPTVECSTQADGHAVTSLKDLNRMSTDITNQLDQIEPLSYDPQNESISRLDWSADFCYILKDHSQIANDTTPASQPGSMSPPSGAATVICPQPLGIEKLASYLEVVDDEKETPSELVVNMIASPFSSDDSLELTKLPRVEASFRRSASGDWVWHQIMAIVNEQALATPLPSLAVDINFKRQLTWTSLCTADSVHDKQLKPLQDAINMSCTEGSKTMMVGSEILLILPASLVASHYRHMKTHHTEEALIQIPYALGRIETVQTRSFQLRRDIEEFEDPGNVVRDIFKTFPANMRLNFREVDGDVVTPSHTSLSLVAYQATSYLQTNTAQQGIGGDQGDEEVQSQQVPVEDRADEFTSPVSSDLTQAAIRVAELLTQSNIGHMRSLARSTGRGREGQWH